MASLPGAHNVQTSKTRMFLPAGVRLTAANGRNSQELRSKFVPWDQLRTSWLWFLQALQTPLSLLYPSMNGILRPERHWFTVLEDLSPRWTTPRFDSIKRNR